MPASSLWSFSAFSFSSAAICLSMRAQLGFTALMSRMDMGVAQLASTADNSNNAPVRISPSTNGLLYPDLKLPFDDVNQHLDPFVAVIEARNVAELFAAMLEEDVLVILRNLLKRLNAIGGKAWADDGNPLDSVSRQRFDRLVSIRLDPLCPAEARLEGELELGTERSERVAQSLDRAQALLLIRVALVHIILRQSMKRCEDDFRLEIKVAKMRPHRFGHRVDIDRVVGIRREGAECRLCAHRL